MPVPPVAASPVAAPTASLLLDRPFLFVGVLHLLPLPAGPGPSLGFSAVRDRALADAEALARGGAHAAIIENFGDAPFPAGPVDPHVVAFVAALGVEVQRAFPGLGLGINLLRNDARAALGVAAAIGAAFLRVNVHTGAMVTDQGLLQGEAAATLRYRHALGSSALLAADVLVKHAVPLAAQEIGNVAADTFRRGRADVLIVTGEGTGRPADPGRVRRVREVVPEAPVWVGSGVTLGSASRWRQEAQGAIIGTALHEGGDVRAPLERARVREMAAALGV